MGGSRKSELEPASTDGNGRKAAPEARTGTHFVLCGAPSWGRRGIFVEAGCPRTGGPRGPGPVEEEPSEAPNTMGQKKALAHMEQLGNPQGQEKPGPSLMGAGKGSEPHGPKTALADVELVGGLGGAPALASPLDGPRCGALAPGGP